MIKYKCDFLRDDYLIKKRCQNKLTTFGRVGEYSKMMLHPGRKNATHNSHTNNPVATINGNVFKTFALK